MKRLKLIVFGCFIGIGIGVSQPPPPHPGGSGNQGAPIAYHSLFFFTALVSTIVCKYKLKK